MKAKTSTRNLMLVVAALVAVMLALVYASYASLLHGSLGTLVAGSAGLTLTGALLLSFVLGLVHGVTPDEHTWPITFSYAIGSYSTRRGALAGLLFSAGFTLQRAIMSELSFLFLAPFLRTNSINGIIYVVVGVVMALSGAYILKKGNYLHFHAISEFFERANHYLFYRGAYAHNHAKSMEEHVAFKKHDVLEDKTRPVPLKLTVVHGLIAGFGFGAFALVLFTVISPSMPNAYVAWVPGALFGAGTMIMQVLFGAIIGFWLQAKEYTQRQIAFISRTTSGNMLAYGGVAFVLAGIFIIAFPRIADFSISTGIGVPNLDSINLGLLLVIGIVTAVAIPSYLYAVRKARLIRR